MKHPAKYNSALLSLFEKLLIDYYAYTVLDCFAGTGRIHELPFNTYGIEIEPEWASMTENTIIADAQKIPFRDAAFDAVCTSPTYANRMADHHNARDKSIRLTYRHMLGRELNPKNSGRMQWGNKYRTLHDNVWKECYRVIRTNGILILNIKNHIRKGKEIDVFSWHVTSLIAIGFKLRQVLNIPLKGMRFGANCNIRSNYEYVAVFKK